MSKSVVASVQSTLLFLDSTKNNRKGATLSQTLSLTQSVTPELISTLNKVNQSFNLIQLVKVIAPIYVNQHLNLIFGPHLHFSIEQLISQTLELNDNLKRNKTGDIIDYLNLVQTSNYRVFAQTLAFIQSASVIKINPNLQSLTFNQSIELTKYQTNPANQSLTFYSYARVYKPDWRFIGGIYP